MKTVLFLDLPYSRGELNEPLAVEFLAAQVESRTGCEVELRCLELGFSAESVVLLVESVHPDLIAVSTKLDSLRLLPLVSEALGRLETRARVVIGGIAATLAPEAVLSAMRPRECTCVVGDGEDVLCRLVQELDDPQSGPGGVVEAAPSAGYGRCFAPNRELLVRTLARDGIARCEASRGCPWAACSFCVVRRKYGTASWRPRAASDVIDELTRVAEMGARMVYFTDEDMIGSDASRALWIAEAIIAAKQDGSIPEDFRLWGATGVLNLLGRYEDARLVRDAVVALKRAGLAGLFLGVESGSEMQLRRYSKGASVADNVNALSLLEELGLETDVGFIMFDPFVTCGELRENIDFIQRTSLKDGFARLGKPVRLTPHMTLTDEALEAGLCDGALDVDTLSFPYRFEDARVQRVFRAFSDWESELADSAYALQSQLRALGYTTVAATKVRSALVALRRRQLEYLSELVERHGS